MIDLKGKSAVITGSGRGIGKAIAAKLALLGASVVISDVNEEDVKAAVKEINSFGCKAIGVKSDVTNPDDAEALIHRCVEEYGSLDILVNNAGITRDTLIVRMKKEQWDQVLQVNLTGTFLCTQAAFKAMLKLKAPGSIINISSIAGERGNFGQTNYAASKAGIIGFTKSVAAEGASRGIRCNAIAPGLVKTGMTDAIPEKIREEMVSHIPVGRIGTPDDIAYGVAFLASDNASYITGIVLDINGGGHLV